MFCPCEIGISWSKMMAVRKKNNFLAILLPRGIPL